MPVIPISYTSHKLEPRSKECLFLGYSTLSKGYLCLDLVTKHLYTSRHVVFNESKFPFSTTSPSLSASPSSIPSSVSNPLWLSNLLYLHSTNQNSLLGPYTSSTTSPQPDLTSFPPFTESLPIHLHKTVQLYLLLQFPILPS